MCVCMRKVYKYMYFFMLSASSIKFMWLNSYDHLQIRFCEVQSQIQG